MCTVSYIGQGNGNFLLTSNRDVPANRSSPIVDTLKNNATSLIYPKDAQADGTWIAMSSDGRVVCLLNGAFKKHQPKPSYRKSRGLMLLEFFGFKDAQDFFERYNFQGIEAFTFIICEREGIWEFRWDETQKHIQSLDINAKYIWSSAPLYDDIVQQKRRNWFNNWAENQDNITLSSIIDFHLNGGEKDNWNGFMMNRMNLVQTVSNTSIQKTNTKLSMRFHDFISDTKMTKTLRTI